LQRLFLLTENLWYVQQLARRTLVLRPERVDLETVLSRAAEAVHGLLEVRGHQLTVVYPLRPDGPWADGDALHWMLVNLLDNAAKWTPDGGHICVQAERRGAEIVFRVQDDGIGIPREELHALLDGRATPRRSRGQSEEGLGLGLPLVRDLAAQQGGQLEAVSAGVGMGSEFLLRLPALRQRPASANVPALEEREMSAASEQVNRLFVVGC
jgi:signal transduction histidine kinase